MKRETKPKVQWCRKRGHIYESFYGLPGNGSYGHGVKRSHATKQAKERYQRSFALQAKEAT